MKRLCLPALLLLIYLLARSSTPVFAQSAAIQNASDVVNNITINAPSEHMVTLKLAPNASPVTRTEYIQIYFQDFNNLTVPTYISGTYTGTPQYSVSGRTVKITGITVVAGAQISIHGITSTNPAVQGWWTVHIFTSVDEAGILIENEAFVDASLNRGTVSITAHIDVPKSQLAIYGIGSPESYITFTQAGTVIGTDVSSFSGTFGKIFAGLEPDTYQVTLFGTDTNRLTTSPVTIIVYTPPFQQTTVSNQILSPTISIDQASYLSGEDITLSGSAVPNGTITLFTQAPLRTYTATASATGAWSYIITNTDEYVTGDYYAYALVQSESGLTSLNSPAIGFSIHAVTTGTPCGDISQGDLNCDGSIDLTDFSILMYYWGSDNAAADINEDGRVNLTDFSTLMYWWGS